MTKAKIVVQNLDSSFYFKVGDAWTMNLEQAFDFQDHQAALRFCEERKLNLSRFQVLEKNVNEAPLPERKQPLKWKGQKLS